MALANKGSACWPSGSCSPQLATKDLQLMTQIWTSPSPQRRHFVSTHSHCHLDLSERATLATDFHYSNGSEAKMQ